MGLHATLKALLEERDNLERRLQIVFGKSPQAQRSEPPLTMVSDVPSLTLRVAPGIGTHVHVLRKREAIRLKGDKDFVSLTESGTTCTLFYKVWTNSISAGELTS